MIHAFLEDTNLKSLGCGETHKSMGVHATNVLKDDPDNRILECARFGRADVIVRGDKEMLRLGEYNRVKIVSLRECLEYR